VQVFLDNFSVYGSKKDHLGQLMCVNLGVLLGHIVCSDGLLVDPQKNTIIIIMPITVNVTKIKRFLGTAGFY
jgi:hypothetical protein